MYMTDPWKEVMLYLEVQPSNKPGNNFVFRGKICGGFNLVNRPFCFNYFVVCSYCFKFRSFNCVRKLKRICQYNSGSYTHSKVTNEPRYPTHRKNWNNNVKYCIQDLAQ